MADNTQKRSGLGIGEAGKVPASTAEDELEAERLQPTPRSEMVRCSCGHMCPREWVMSAALGTSCPDCYDRMDGAY